MFPENSGSNKERMLIKSAILHNFFRIVIYFIFFYWFFYDIEFIFNVNRKKDVESDLFLLFI